MGVTLERALKLSALATTRLPRIRGICKWQRRGTGLSIARRSSAPRAQVAANSTVFVNCQDKFEAMRPRVGQFADLIVHCFGHSPWAFRSGPIGVGQTFGRVCGTLWEQRAVLGCAPQADAVHFNPAENRAYLRLRDGRGWICERSKAPQPLRLVPQVKCLGVGASRHNLVLVHMCGMCGSASVRLKRNEVRVPHGSEAWRSAS